MAEVPEWTIGSENIPMRTFSIGSMHDYSGWVNEKNLKRKQLIGFSPPERVKHKKGKKRG